MQAGWYIQVLNFIKLPLLVLFVAKYSSTCTCTSCHKNEYYGTQSHSVIHHHLFNVHILPRLIKSMDGCFPSAIQHKVDIFMSGISRLFHFDFCNFNFFLENHCLVTIRAVYPNVGNVGTSFWRLDVLPDQTSLDLGRDAGSGNLMSGSGNLPLYHPLCEA